MKDVLEKIKAEALSVAEDLKDLKGLDELRVKLLGKKGSLTAALKSLGGLSAEERPAMGQMINEVRAEIETLLSKKQEELGSLAMNLALKSEKLDVTMPGTRPYELGKKHPMTLVTDELKDIFIGLGYEVAEGPEIEEEYYSFDALNTPKHHPARDEQDTFYVEAASPCCFVLRTQTSPVQVRTMESRKPPIKIIAPGRVFRKDEVDATHSPVFHQLEGLVVDKGITMGDLKGALSLFAKELFGGSVKTRFRPHYFPFTEPSAEMDVSCFACEGRGCRICKGSGWIELLGCGMVHPKVLSMSGIDPQIYTGFAFGMGLERVAMQRYNITDMRLLYENDVRFLKQF
ncbi:MAG: phenylalanine--tRNA ligase subunit alpha [Defluviitaleaceae bacterium]|nr:phenylalanine--tRNA ligase subunit alpha [Defluviitaleaceae bacterium]